MEMQDIEDKNLTLYLDLMVKGLANTREASPLSLEASKD
jgi:hypothetical protein